MKVAMRWSVILLAAVCGCGSNDQGAMSGGTVNTPPPPTVDSHDHPSEGPHHGTLVELGEEEFHAEVVHEKDSVTVYILDSSAKNSVPIDSTEVVINAMHDGKPEQFKLPASPDANDGPAKSSRFALTDADLASHMDDHVATPKLSVTINGKAYRGEIHHDHASHDHAH